MEAKLGVERKRERERERERQGDKKTKGVRKRETSSAMCFLARESGSSFFSDAMTLEAIPLLICVCAHSLASIRIWGLGSEAFPDAATLKAMPLLMCGDEELVEEKMVCANSRGLWRGDHGRSQCRRHAMT